MLSITTIALSPTRPSAMIRAAIEICWMSRPQKYIAAKVPRMVIGSIAPTISAERRPMNRYMITRIRASPASRFS